MKKWQEKEILRELKAYKLKNEDDAYEVAFQHSHRFRGSDFTIVTPTLIFNEIGRQFRLELSRKAETVDAILAAPSVSEWKTLRARLEKEGKI